MEKTRVPKGEKYWHIGPDLTVYCLEEKWWPEDESFYNAGNYFLTEEEAESMANKLRAVLKGADVIEMPSDEEFEQIRIHESFNMWDEETNGKAKGWKDCFTWLKSKIVK